MIDVVAHEVLERDGAVARHRAEGTLVEVVHRTAPRAVGRGRRRHHARELPVVRQPEHHELEPWRVLIALTRYPPILLVALDDEIGPRAHADEALVVVARRVDEVPDDL